MLWDVPKFLGTYAFDTKFRDEVNTALELASQAIAKYSEGKTKGQMISDLVQRVGAELKSQYEELKKLPPEEQAFKIGEITGSVLLMLAGPKLAKDFIKSSALRIRSVAKESQAIKNVGKIVENVAKAVEKVQDVRTWDDLESFASTVQRVRGRKDLGGDEIRRIINGIRAGDPQFSPKMLPKAGGFREYAMALVKDGGHLSDATVAKLGTNWVDNTVDASKATYRKFSEIRNKFFRTCSPNELADDVAKVGNEFGRVRKIHDFLDDTVVSVRESLGKFHSEILKAKFSDAQVAL